MEEDEMMTLTQDEIKKQFNNLKEWLNFENSYEKEELIKALSNLEFISPQEDDVFNAFKIGENVGIINPQDINVLILGQDPYPNPQKAQGLAFSHKNGNKVDASLLNIFRAIKVHKDENIKNFNEVKDKDVKWNTDLTIWAKNNGILLLNTALTYKNRKLKSEHQLAWKIFIQKIITKLLNCNNSKLVVFLWGADAQLTFINCLNDIKITRDIRIFTCYHPSPQNENNPKIKDKYLLFSEKAPDHFKNCDEFLFGKDEEKYIFKNFPKNNTEEYYKNKK